MFEAGIGRRMEMDGISGSWRGSIGEEEEEAE